MSGTDDEVIGKLSEELVEAMSAGEIIDAKEWAQRFDVDEKTVRQCQRGLQALVTSIGEEPENGHPELPQPQLPNDFEVVGELGRGGMGVVYRARQRSLDRDVAVKVLRPGDLVFGDALRRFRAEARSLARLRHRHIVSVYDSGETPEGLVWFAMDLVDGQTLADELRKRGSMLPARATKIIRQVASAIAHAHAQGIVHRDLKPQNVLIDANGDAFVVDFGLARDASAAGSRTMSGELLGTPAYMSPEQARGDAANIGEASDVWALGALLYEMLGGRGPFSGKPLHETIRAILHDDPPPLRRGDKRVPADLERICRHALHKRTEDRYAGALAFGEDVERFQDGRGVLAQKPSTTARVARMLRRRWRSVATIAAAVVVTLTAVAAWLPSIRRDAVIAEARRLVASGHAEAGRESLEAVMASERQAEDFEALELDLATALNDQAGERLLQDDDAGATKLAQRAAEIADRHARHGGVTRPEQWEPKQMWRWQLARASVLADPQRMPFVDMALLQADLHCGLNGRMAMARRVATMDGVDLSKLEVSRQLDIVRDGLRAHGRMVSGSSANLATPRHSWMRRIDPLWSPELEDLLADMATDDNETASTRALAFRMWSLAVGLPTFTELRDAARATADHPSVAQVAKAAPAAIQRWLLSRDLAREDACKARIDLLASEMERPGEVLPGAGTSIRGIAATWTGHTTNSTQEFLAWWQEARQGSYSALLRDGLELPAEQTTSLAKALDQSATADTNAACLWRQLAWLQVPAGERIPQGSPGVTNDGNRWRTVCLRAAGQVDGRKLTARAVVLRFDDGACQPEIVAQQCKVVRIGETVELNLRARVAENSWLSLREVWEDEDNRVAPWISAYQPRLSASRPDPGEITAALRGDVRLDRHGVRFEPEQGRVLRHSLPWTTTQESHQGLNRVWLGCGGALDAYTVAWELDQRVTSFVLVVALDETGARPEASLGWWHQVLENSFASALDSDKAILKRRHSADWLTASLWPMPSALTAMQALHDDGRRMPTTEQGIAMSLAGSSANILQWPEHGSPRSRTLGVRLATGSASPDVQSSALASLAAFDDSQWTPRLAQTVQSRADQLPLDLPPALTERLASMPTPDGVVDLLTRAKTGNALLVMVLLLAMAWYWHKNVGDPRRMAWTVTAFALLGLLYVRIEIADVVLTPSFVILALVLLCAAGACTARPWWRIVGLGLLGLSVVAAAASWFFGASSPRGLGPLILVGVYLATLCPREHRERHATIKALPAAGKVTQKTPRRRRSPSRSGSWLLTLGVLAFACYGGLQVISSNMSRTLLATAELRIVDQTGQPVPGVRAFAEYARPRPLFTGHELPLSDENGYIDLSTLQGRTATLARFHITVQLPGYRHEPVLLEESTEIRVPEVGVLTVQLLDADGQPWRDPSNSEMYSMMSSDFQHRQAFDADGRAVFPAVACGKLRMTTHLQAAEDIDHGEIDGPARAGETRTVLVTIPADTPRITGTVVDADGKPVQGKVNLSFRKGNTYLSSWKVIADSNGRFRFLIHGDPRGGTLTLSRLFGKNQEIKVPAGDGPVFDVGTVKLRRR